MVMEASRLRSGGGNRSVCDPPKLMSNSGPTVIAKFFTGWFDKHLRGGHDADGLADGTAAERSVKEGRLSRFDVRSTPRSKGMAEALVEERVRAAKDRVR